MNDFVPSVRDKTPGYFSLFRYSNRLDVFYTVFGCFLAMVAGTLPPLTNEAYSEIVNAMLDRQYPPKNESTYLPLLSFFGGGRILSNASQDEQMDALMEDVAAHGWISFGFSFFTVFIAAFGVALVKFSASSQSHHIRKKLFRAVLCHDMKWFDQNGGQNFVANLNEEVAMIEEGIGSHLAYFMCYLNNIILGMVISCYLSWKLTLVLGSLIPVNFFLGVVVLKFQNKMAGKEIKFLNEAGSVFTEAVTNIRTVLAFGGQNKEIEKYREKLEEASVFATRRGFFSSFSSAISWGFYYLTFIGAFLYGSVLFADNEPLYIIEMVFMSIWLVTIRFGMSHRLFEKMSAAVGSSVSIFETLQTGRGVDPLSNRGIKLSKLNGEILFRNAHFCYASRPKVPILTDINFSVKAGETVAIVGSSGSGKTTILQLVQRFYDLDEAIDDVCVKKLNVNWWRQQIGVVGQEAALFAGTIRENIRYGFLNATDQEIEAAAVQSNAHDFIKKLRYGYDTVIGSKGATLSGGEKQRIAIARALIRDPKILLLDEPTSALDAESRDIVQAALNTASEGRTTLLVTHRLSSAASADRIIVFDQGRIAEEGTHDSLLANNGLYKEMLSCEVNLEQKSVQKAPKRILVEEKFESECAEAPLIAVIDKKKNGQHFLKLLNKWNEPESILLISGAVAAAISGSLLPSSAIIYGEFLGAFSLNNFEAIQEKINIFAWVEFAVLLVMFSTVFGALYLFIMAREKLTNRLRLQAFTCILKQEMGWFDDARNQVGALYTRFTNDVNSVHNFSGPSFAAILQGCFNLTTGFILGLYYSWKLTLVMEAFILPALFLGPIVDNFMTKKEETYSKKSLESASKVASEALGNKQVVASLGLEELFIGRYNSMLDQASSNSFKASLARGFGFGLTQAVPPVAFGICFWYGCYLIKEENVPFQDVVRVSEILLIGAMMAASELVFISAVSSARTATNRLAEFFNRQSMILDGQDLLPEDSDKIIYSDVTMIYPTRPGDVILRGVDLSITNGQRLAVVGPSGSGKSSILHLLQRLYDPYAGKISIDEKNIKNLTLASLRHHLGLVSQEPSLFSGTIYENIAYGDNSREISIEEIIQAAKIANIHEFIMSLPSGYETKLGKNVQLSGGQKQRIAIARALVRNPRVLLLDEATSALDPESERIVQEALNKATNGRTTITVAHRLGAIANADTIIRIENGRVVVEK